MARLVATPRRGVIVAACGIALALSTSLLAAGAPSLPQQPSQAPPQVPLGPRQAQIFDRETTREEVQVLRPEGAERPNNITTGRYLRAGPPVLLGGELGRKGEHVVVLPPNLRDLGLVLAADRRFLKRGRAEYALPYRNANAALTLRARFERPKGGRQTIEAILAAQGEPSPSQDHWSGTITIDRAVDDDAAHTASFRVRYDLSLTFAANHRPKTTADQTIEEVGFEIEETWTQRAVLDGDTPEFRSRVFNAIQQGRDYAEKQLANITQPEFKAEEPNTHQTGSGYLALTVLTAIKAGTPKDNKHLVAALTELRQRDMTNTYCLATSLMAFEALYAPEGERDALIRGALAAPSQRQPSAADLELMKGWATRLLGNIDTTQDAAYVRRFHYHPSTSWDNSNSQYALLGLYAAHLCGIEISVQVWYAAARHFIDCQRDEGVRAIGLQLATQSEAMAAAKRGGRGGTRGGGRKVSPMGWAYYGTGNATGSMTTAGLTGVTLAQAALEQQRRLDRNLGLELDNALHNGFGWFAEHLTVRTNPTTGHGAHSWHYYYLYGLERACELNEVATIQGRDWYFEGAVYLLEDHFSGGLGGIADTCFAVLFLKKAAMPTVITGR